MRRALLVLTLLFSVLNVQSQCTIQLDEVYLDTAASGCNNKVFKYKISGGTATSFSWDYGDGNSCTCIHPKNRYNKNGTFQLCGKIQDANGCRDSLCITVNVNCSNPCDLSEIGIYSADTLSYDCNDIEFNAIVSSNTKHLKWDFGDGDSSSNKYIIHTFKKKGQYNVVLIIRDSINCADTAEWTVDVLCDKIICEQFLTKLDIISLARSNMKQLNVSSTKTPLYYWWQYGDGNSGYGPASVNYTYQDSGIMQICVYAKDSIGCNDTICDMTRIILPKDNSITTPNDILNQILVHSIPSQQLISISIPMEGNIKMFTINGQLVYSGQLKEGDNTISTEGLSNGLYLLQIDCLGYSKVFKINSFR